MTNSRIKKKINDDSGNAQKEVTEELEKKDTAEATKQKDGERTLKDAVKPKRKRKNKSG